MFPERIRLLRKSQDLSQVELAGRLGVSKQSVSNWENGNILPSIDMLVKISTVFNVSTDYILGLDNRSSGDRCYLEVKMCIRDRCGDEREKDQKIEELVEVIGKLTK